MKVEISNGELVDKYTILEIKLSKITDDEKLENIRKEKDSLFESVKSIIDFSSELFLSLKKVNEKLWDIEDKIREKERVKEFDDTFIELARSVYHTNDIRANLKKQINIATCSHLIEEKSYEHY